VHERCAFVQRASTSLRLIASTARTERA